MATKRKIGQISGGKLELESLETVDAVAPVTADDAHSTTSSSAAAAASAIRGVAGSKRVWKPIQKTRFSADTRISGHSTTNSGTAFAVRKAHKMARDAAKVIAQRLKATQEAERMERRKKLEDKRKRKAENEFKSASYQVISDPATMKRMNKKQLQQVKRMRVNAAGVPEFTKAYD